jgi:hypothetical protein
MTSIVLERLRLLLRRKVARLQLELLHIPTNICYRSSFAGTYGPSMLTVLNLIERPDHPAPSATATL